MVSTPTSSNASTTTPPAQIHDDKSPLCIPFILSLLESHSQSPEPTTPNRPFIIGLNGIQGSGKTTLVSLLSSTLSQPPYLLPTLVLSIDDLYLPHSAQSHLASTHQTNKLLQHRGEPGTHDTVLAKEVLGKLLRGEEVKVPSYDKSAFNGQGDRVPVSEWKTVNKPGEERVRVVILEGWCIGFRSLPHEALECAYAAPSKTLFQHAFSDLQFINDALREYDVLTDAFDAMIHIDAEHTEYVYDWRQEQERKMRALGKGGMSEEEVEVFVDGYYPAYELYTGELRRGVFKDEGRQLRLVVGRNRRVREVVRI